MASDALRTLMSLAMVILTTGATADPPQARSQDARPAFDELVVKFEPSLFAFFGPEQLQIHSNGRCWYRAEGRKAGANVPAQSGGVFDHMLSADGIQRLNRLLKDTQWLTAKGGKGPPTHTDAGTITLTLRREGGQTSVVCHGRRPEPYASLLLELQGLATQERRIYLHDYVSGKTGTAAWLEIGQELDALRGGPYAKSPFTIDYQRYLPIARRIVRNFYGETDHELITAVRLIGHFRVKSELMFLHRMAHDRSPYLRREVAWALGRIHDPQSLPVLEAMMSAQATSGDVGFELIQWGGEAVPHIVNLISLSTDDSLERRENTIGENMIRAYLDHWDRIDQTIHPRVVAQVRKSLESKDPRNGLIRTTYHREFLRMTATN